jgi:peroxiredoxin
MRQTLAVLGLAVLASSAAAAPSIGDKLEPFALKDATSGKDVDLKSAAGKKATVLMFVSTQCPVSNNYNERMVALAKDYSGKGVSFLGINSNRQEAVDEIAGHAKESGFTFPVLKDTGNVKADEFGAKVTPEVYVYDADWKLRYHGRIDDKQKVSEVSSKDLAAALDAVIAGKEVPVAETKAFGCTIKRVSKSADAPAPAKDAAKAEAPAQ